MCLSDWAVMIKPQERSPQGLWPRQWEGDLDFPKDGETEGKREGAGRTGARFCMCHVEFKMPTRQLTGCAEQVVGHSLVGTRGGS